MNLGSDITIYGIDGVGKISLPFNRESIYKRQVMDDHYIKLSFPDPGITLKRGDYLLYDGIKFSLDKDCVPSDGKLSPQFYAPECLFKNYPAFYMKAGVFEAEWGLTGNPLAFLRVFVECINFHTKGVIERGTLGSGGTITSLPQTGLRGDMYEVVSTGIYGGLNLTQGDRVAYFDSWMVMDDLWVIGVVEPTVSISLSFNEQNIFDSLSNLAEKCECEWWADGNSINLGKCEGGLFIDLISDQAIGEMKPSKSDEEFCNRVYAFGSTRNLPSTYRKAESDTAEITKRLKLPIGTPYVDSASLKAIQNPKPEQVVARVKIFDVYPKMVCTIDDITSESVEKTEDHEAYTKYSIHQSQINFLDTYKLPGEDLSITFQSGRLSGREFVVSFKNGWFEIVNIDTPIYIPNITLCPTIGDEFILFNFNIQLVSDQYVQEAENELKTKAQEFVDGKDKDTNTYDCPSNPVWCELNNLVMLMGQKVRLYSETFKGGYRESRIYGFERKLANIFDCLYTVGDSSKYSKSEALNSKVEQMQYASYATNQGGQSVIKKDDPTLPTDKNLFSSLRTIKEIIERSLSKTSPDSAEAIITFLSGIVSDSITSKSFLQGILGSGYKLWIEDGISNLEIDNLSVRRGATFRELTIEELKSVGGQIIASMANMKCTKVIETADRYECYFDNDNGNIGNPFRVNDQARCQKFTGAGVKYYWRLVTGVGPDYINLSKTDCDGSGIPEAGDSIVQLGHRTDPSRQNAIIISSLEPSFKQYTGIHSYSLVGCEKTVISPEGNKLTGELYVTTDTGVSRVPRDRGFWIDGMECTYYDRLSHKGALWLCVVPEGTTTTDEPSLLSAAWEKQVAEGDDGTSPILVTIESTHGDNFHNGVISTTLTAKVFSGNEEITSTLNQSCFRWIRKSSNEQADAAWNSLYSTFGSNVISISGDDVNFKAVFNCQVTITT